MKNRPYKRPADIARSALMRRVRQKGTSAELEVGRLLAELGLRFRRNVRSLPGSPDFANKSRKWAIFVNGCFWHHHGECHRATIPKRNRSFWVEKFGANRARDLDKRRQLRRLGFRILTVWECEVGKARLVKRIANWALMDRCRDA